MHLHLLVPDGVYTLEQGTPRFHAVAAPHPAELEALLEDIIARILRQLERDQLLLRDADHPHLDLTLDDPLDQFGNASLQYRVILGPNPGSKVMTLRTPTTARPDPRARPFTVTRSGFSLDASVACRAEQRAKLERLARYVARPPLALDRLSVTDDGRLRYALKHPFSDGTTHFLFHPLDLLARLATLVPRPRVHLTRYHGIFAPNSALRALVVPGQRKAAAAAPTRSPHRHELAHPPAQRLTWAERLKRTFAFDVTVCPLCAGTLRVIADITDPALIDKILSHFRNSRAPPAQALRTAAVPSTQPRSA